MPRNVKLVAGYGVHSVPMGNVRSIHDGCVHQRAIDEGADDFDVYKVNKANGLLRKAMDDKMFLPLGRIDDFDIMLSYSEHGIRDVDLDEDRMMNIALCPMPFRLTYIVGLYQNARQPLALVNGLDVDKRIVECSAAYGGNLYGGKCGIRYSLEELDALLKLPIVDRYRPAGHYARIREPWILPVASV